MSWMGTLVDLCIKGGIFMVPLFAVAPLEIVCTADDLRCHWLADIRYEARGPGTRLGFCRGIGAAEASVLTAGDGAGLACGLCCAAGLPLLWQPSLNVLQKSSPIWSRALATGLSEGPRSLACASGMASHIAAPSAPAFLGWEVVMILRPVTSAMICIQVLL